MFALTAVDLWRADHCRQETVLQFIEVHRIFWRFMCQEVIQAIQVFYNNGLVELLLHVRYSVVRQKAVGFLNQRMAKHLPTFWISMHEFVFVSEAWKEAIASAAR